MVREELLSRGPAVVRGGGLGKYVDFRACAEAGEEEVDLLFNGAVGEVWAEELVEVSDAGVCEGCDCAAVRGAENGCIKKGGVFVYCEFAGGEHVQVGVNWVVIEGDEVLRLWRGSGGGEDGDGGMIDAIVECCKCGGAGGGLTDCVVDL
jgi:hypothetical protein